MKKFFAKPTNVVVLVVLVIMVGVGLYMYNKSKGDKESFQEKILAMSALNNSLVA